MGITPEPIGRACQQSPRGVKRQDRVLDVRGQDIRCEPLRGRDRLVEPHEQVPGVERHTGDVGAELR